MVRSAPPVWRLQVIWTQTLHATTNPLLLCITFLVLFSGRLFTGSVIFFFVCLFLGRLLHPVAAVLRLGSSLSAELIDTYVSQSKTQKRARVHIRDPVSAPSVSLKASFVVKGDQAGPCAWLSAWTCVRARRSVFWMLYRLKRAPATSMCRERAHGMRGVLGEGVNGRGRTGKEKARYTRHGGKQKNTQQWFNSRTFLFARVSASEVWSWRSLKCNFLSSATASSRCRQPHGPERGADTVNDTQLPAKTQHNERWQTANHIVARREKSRLSAAQGRETVPLSSGRGRAETGPVLC